MGETDPALRNLVRRLLAYEAGDTSDPGQMAEAANRACEKLRQRLTPLIGSTGFHAVIVRALRLAQQEFPFLAGIELAQEEGTELRSFLKRIRGLEYVQVVETVSAVLSNCLTTLVDLWGWDMSYKLVGAAYPEVAIGEGSVQATDGAV